jgi:glutaredoxin
MTIIKAAPVLIIPLVLLFLLPADSLAEMYRYTDDKGNVVFTDSPPLGIETEKLKQNDYRDDVPTYTIEPGTGPDDYRAPDIKADEKRPYSDIRVVMYMTSWCKYCRKARQLINSMGVDLTEYDIEKDRSRRREMLSKGYGKGVPLIDVEGIVINGYSPSAIQAAIEKRRIQ